MPFSLFVLRNSTTEPELKSRFWRRQKGIDRWRNGNQCVYFSKMMYLFSECKGFHVSILGDCHDANARWHLLFLWCEAEEVSENLLIKMDEFRIGNLSKVVTDCFKTLSKEQDDDETDDDWIYTFATIGVWRKFGIDSTWFFSLKLVRTDDSQYTMCNSTQGTSGIKWLGRSAWS